MATYIDEFPDGLPYQDAADIFVRSNQLHLPGAKWGFALVRATTSATTPAIWDTALQRICDLAILGVSQARRRHGLHTDDRPEQLVRTTLDLPVIEVGGVAAADDDAVRAAFAEWLGGAGRGAHIAEEACLALDDAAVASLANNGDAAPSLNPSPDEAYVRVVDAGFGGEMSDSESEDEGHPDYAGWMRAPAALLTDLYEHITKVSAEIPMSQWFPEEWDEAEDGSVRIPVYRGDMTVDLVDPSVAEEVLSDAEIVDRALAEMSSWT
ncbi:hypothetical protein K461DRAFT_283084 [Myriangium duriaei CBS 260.36]|uniref:Uncharacterized protein n=1 Tax=Myriangium duriaei CBS 260.36 TaxID=1168546 RepID=A0A9P4IUB3_9PEZI|nr:hypothetical protein K461DRAFT_283084 [Myriangium duriaei CBS 260.36]